MVFDQLAHPSCVLIYSIIDRSIDRRSDTLTPTLLLDKHVVVGRDGANERQAAARAWPSSSCHAAVVGMRVGSYSNSSKAGANAATMAERRRRRRGGAHGRKSRGGSRASGGGLSNTV
jgi:hypothetical protein